MTFDEAAAQLAVMDSPMDRVFAVLPDGIDGSSACYMLLVSREGRYVASRMAARTTTVAVINKELDTQERRLPVAGHTLEELRDALPISSKALRWLVFDVESFVRWHNRRLRLV